MTEPLAFENPPNHFNNHLLPFPPNAPPPTFPSRAHASIIDAYSQAASLFHACEYHQAIQLYKRLLQQKQDPVSEVLILFNIGILRDHLGEHSLAGEAYEKAVRLDGSFSIGWFCLGNAASLIGNFRRALRVFKICEKTIRGNFIDYHQQGLPWTLEKTRVIFNIRQTELRKLHKQHKGPLDHVWSLNRLPAGNIFELGRGVVLGIGWDVRTPTNLSEPELLEPQTHVGVLSAPVRHGQFMRHGTTQVSDPQKPLPPIPDKFPSPATINESFRRDHTQFAAPEMGRLVLGSKKSVSLISQANSSSTQRSPRSAMAPRLSSPVNRMPSQYASLSSLRSWESQSFNSRYHPMRPPDNQKHANVQPPNTDTRNCNLGSQKGAPGVKFDSFSIFALGEPQLRKLQAAANEASTSPAETLGRSRSLKRGRSSNKKDTESEVPQPTSDFVGHQRWL
jgi:tetratricopeptide (TPR) repeat protein